MIRQHPRGPVPAGYLFSLLVALAAGGCAKSDPVTGSAGGGTGEGGYDGADDDGAGGEQNHYEEAGPEVGAGAGESTSSQGGAEGDPSSGGNGAGEATSSSSGGEVCGDGTCQMEEGCDTCPADCGACEAECGDGVCEEAEGEACDNCAPDCGACPICGDGVCDEPAEDCDLCFEDCGICPCAPDDFETNNGSGSATPIALNTEYPDLSVCSGDADWLEFTLNGTRTVTLTFNQAEGDLDLEIFDEATLGYVAGSYSHDDDETVVLSGQPSGTYWARVYGYMSATNPDYAIEVSD